MKIICVGRNYAAHAKELNNEVPKEPLLFMKPDSSILQKRNPFIIPDFSNEIHYETELVVKINRLGKHIQQKFAAKYYKEIALGIDFTARDLQDKCRKEGLPWEKAKAFDGSCLVGKFVPISSLNHIEHITFHMEKNDEIVQKGDSADMIFNIDFLISHISSYFTLKIGDLIFTGTPDGVGPVKSGDQLKGYLGDEMNFSVNIR